MALFHSNGSIQKVDGVSTVWLRHGDRLALGNCSHILQCVAPPPDRGSRLRAAGVPPSQEGDIGGNGSRDVTPSKRGARSLFGGGKSSRGSRSRAEGGGDNAVSDMEMAVTKDGNMVTGMHLTWNQCVREVMLQRPEDGSEYSERLAAMVVTRWRLPLTRAMFEETLLQAIHSAQEANAIASSLGAYLRFRVSCGGVVDTAHLYSLRLDDALPHHRVNICVQAVRIAPHSTPEEIDDAANGQTSIPGTGAASALPSAVVFEVRHGS